MVGYCLRKIVTSARIQLVVSNGAATVSGGMPTVLSQFTPKKNR